MQPHQQRVVDEKNELDDRVVKLKAFMVGAIFPTLGAEERADMGRQAEVMAKLSRILGRRIERFRAE